MTAIIFPAIIFTIGLAAGTRHWYRQLRALRAMYALRRTTPNKRLRRQIKRQYLAEQQVRRATTVTWFGRGGTHVFLDV